MQKGGVALALSLILSIVAVVGVLAIGYFVLQNPKLDSKNQAMDPTPVPSAFNTFDKTAQTDRLAYTNNGNLYILEDGKSRRLTTGGFVGQIRWVPGKTGKIAFIKLVHLYTEGGDMWIGFEIDEIDTKSGEVSTILPRKFSDDQLRNGNTDYEIRSFDFSPDGKSFAYARDGFYINDSQGKEIKVAENTIDKQNPVVNSRYGQVQWSPRGDKILLTKTAWEWTTSEIYDVLSRKLVDVPLGSVEKSWSDSGKSILGYRGLGMSEGGVWVFDLASQKAEQYLSGQYSAVEISGGAFLPNGTIVTVMAPFPNPSSESFLPSNKISFYKILGKNDVELVKEISETNNFGYGVFQLQPSSDGEEILYFRSVGQSEYDIEKLDLKSKNVTKLVTGISRNDRFPSFALEN